MLKKLTLLFAFIFLSITDVFAVDYIENNAEKTVWELCEIDNQTSKNLIEYQKNPFNLYFRVASSKDYDKDVLRMISANLNGYNNSYPYQTLAEMYMLDIIQVCRYESEISNYCNDNQDSKFCELHLEFCGQQSKRINTAYNIFKAMALSYNEPFNVDLEIWQRCMDRNEPCKLKKGKLLLYIEH